MQSGSVSLQAVQISLQAGHSPNSANRKHQITRQMPTSRPKDFEATAATEAAWLLAWLLVARVRLLTRTLAAADNVQ